MHTLLRPDKSHCQKENKLRAVATHAPNGASDRGWSQGPAGLSAMRPSPPPGASRWGQHGHVSPPEGSLCLPPPVASPGGSQPHGSAAAAEAPPGPEAWAGPGLSFLATSSQEYAHVHKVPRRPDLRHGAPLPPRLLRAAELCVLRARGQLGNMRPHRETAASQLPRRTGSARQGNCN